MNKWLRSAYYSIKNAYTDKITLFWTIVFPLLLVTFFYLSFGSLVKGQSIDKINIAVDKNYNLSMVYESIGMFNVHKVDENKAMELLKERKVSGYVNSKGRLYFAKKGVYESVIKNIADGIKQVSNSGLDYRSFDFEKTYLKLEREDISIFSNYFYTVVAMISLYGIFYGVELMTIVQPWDSKVALRVSISPKSKRSLIMESAIVGIVISVIVTIILMIYIQYVLGLKIFRANLWNLFLIVIGGITGMSMGVFLGQFIRLKSTVKVLISVLLLNFMSFANGMVNTSVKNTLEDKFPLVMKINPISIISDNFIKINIFERSSEIFLDSAILLVMSTILFILTISKLRGDRFDSI